MCKWVVAEGTKALTGASPPHSRRGSLSVWTSLNTCLNHTATARHDVLGCMQTGGREFNEVGSEQRPTTDPISLPRDSDPFTWGTAATGHRRALFVQHEPCIDGSHPLSRAPTDFHL